MKSLTKKGQAFNQISSLAIGILGFVMALVVAFLIVAKVKTQSGVAAGYDASNATLCAQEVGCNATNQLMTDTYSIVGWASLVILIIIAVLVLGYVKMMRN